MLRLQAELHSNQRRLVLGAVFGFALACASHALAEEEEAPSVVDIRTAEAEFTKGRDAFKAGNYAEAADFFESADNHAPNERVLELALTARDEAGQLDRAATNARLAVERYPDDQHLLELATPILEAADREMLRVNVTCDEACSLLDGTRIVHGHPALQRTIYLPPGDHDLRAGWSEDRTESKNVSGSAGETVLVTFVSPDLQPEPAPVVAAPAPAPEAPIPADRPPAAESGGLPTYVFWIGAGVSAALAGATIWSGVDTLENPGKNTVIDRCAGQGEECPEYKDGRRRQLRTNILLGATGGVGLATIVIGAFFTDWSGSDRVESASRGKAAISPWIDVADGATLGASGRF